MSCVYSCNLLQFLHKPMQVMHIYIYIYCRVTTNLNQPTPPKRDMLLWSLDTTNLGCISSNVVK